MRDPLHARVDALMKEADIDALLLTGNTFQHPSFSYLVRGEKLENAVLVYKRSGRKVLLCSDMERDNAARTGLPWMPFSRTSMQKLAKQHAGNPRAFRVAWLRWALAKAKVKGKLAIYGPVALEGAALWLDPLRRALRQDGITIVPEERPILERARETKTEFEIERIREAGVGTCAAFAALRRFIGRCKADGANLVTAKGEAVTIGDLKRVVRETLAKYGLVEISASIVAQGEEAGVPHNAGTDSRKVKVGQPIIADIFPRSDSGYYFDMTRTFVPGEASEKMKAMYADTLAALRKAFRGYRRGMKAYDVHLLASELYAGKGYETPDTHPGTQIGFCHGLGHGLGLEVHEEPFMRKTQAKLLEPGMVITIEPGLYYPERKQGVRLEDVAVVRENKLENITNFAYKLEVPLKG